MSLYNQLFGVNTFGGLVLHMLGLDPREVPRLRDAYVTDDGYLAIFARVGGGNRSYYAEGIGMLRGHLGYVRDQDDGFDSTYATFYYEAPEAFAGIVLKVLKQQGHYDPMERFQQMLDDMEHNRDTPLAQRAYEVGKPVIEAIDAEMEAQAAGEEPKNILMLDADFPAREPVTGDDGSV